MIQIYHGDGKGKTTASVGLAIRAAGRNVPVIFAQFLKDDSSGEINILKTLPQVKLIHPTVFHGFVSRMSEQELEDTKKAYKSMLQEIELEIEKCLEEKTITSKKENAQVNGGDATNDIKLCVVLDEILHALHYKLLDEDAVIYMLVNYRDNVEFILTGRNPSSNILEMANYVTEMKKEKHPFDWGIPARIGIEL